MQHQNSVNVIVASSGIHHGIRRIKPYVLNRNGRKPRDRELFQALDGHKYGKGAVGVKYPCREQFVWS